MPPLILASASPRRRLLLEQAGYAFAVDPSDVAEPEPVDDEPMDAYVTRLAWSKARAVAARHNAGWILAADTSCAVAGHVLNKPADRADAERMIRLQEGRDVDVWTGVCLWKARTREWLGGVELGVCHFRVLSDPERIAYLDSGRWEGKAGAYGLQDDDPIVRMVAGEWSTIVGLPMGLVGRLLRTCNLT